MKKEKLEDEEGLQLVQKVWKKFDETNRSKKIKQCLYPNHDECTDNILKAHAIQNNGVLTQIAENGKVLC
ncbi:hypothetical protein [Furfurilactobacillus curtus]|uniref:Uncharacterized protein n=1 Tax=Furfurilactobacillus curtus TaxID=1746200 RepID=A0ABQ5JLQ0_9LACO